MTDRDEPPADAQKPPASTGRHGGGTGLSVAELIARSGAASPGAGPRLSRSARHSGQDADISQNAAAAASAMPATTAGSGFGPAEASLTAGPAAASPTAGPAEASPAAGPAAASPTAGPAEASPGAGPAAAAPARHLRIVEALRSGGSGKPARGGLALVEPPAGRPDTAAASTARPSTVTPDPDTSEAPGSTGLGTAPSRNGRHPAGSPAR
ncbi:MAG TPA: hypothetical protein VGX49_00575, partial [Jatrophihabitans sp.]|nr:hypothetical protein [Jatrophihabitans sp.]